MEMMNINGVAAVKINAKVLKIYQNSILLNCEGDEVWFPTAHIKINKDGTVLIEKWLYDAKVAEGKL